MAAYISRDDSYALEHHGVKGMKWGVRHNKPRLGTSARTFAKRDKFKAKINKTGDSNIVKRNFINDRRRGRIQALSRKAEHRQAKEAYRAGKGTREQVRTARNNRLKYNVGGRMLVGYTSRRGRYTRYRNTGDDVTSAVLKTAGTVAIGGIVAGQAMSIGRSIILEAMKKSAS